MDPQTSLGIQAMYVEQNLYNTKAYVYMRGLKVSFDTTWLTK